MMMGARYYVSGMIYKVFTLVNRIGGGSNVKSGVNVGRGAGPGPRVSS